MKVFGFDDADVVRGEIRATMVSTEDMRWPAMLRKELDWVYCSSRFAEVKTTLLSRMSEEDSDPDLIQVVRGLKAAFIPIDE